MSFADQNSGIAASVYLAIYSLYVPFMCFVIYKRGFKSRYSLLLFYALIRFGGQLCGVVHAVIGPQYWKWLIAYLVLGAEGYFALILATFYTTCKAQSHGVGFSILAEKGPPIPNNIPFFGRLVRSWSALFKMVLIPANIVVIISGILLSGMSTEDVQQQSDLLNESRVLRTVGQSMFLALSVVAVVANQYVMWVQGIRNMYTVSATVASPFLLVRGTFGVMSIYLSAMDYFNVENYTDGLADNVVIYEYVLGTTMEFLASVALVWPYILEGKKKNDMEGQINEDFKDES